MTLLPRRDFGALSLQLIASLGLGASGLFASGLGCSAAPPPKVPVNLPPLKTEELTSLVTAAGLSWIVLVKPRTIAAIPWLIPEIGLFAPEKNLDVFRREVGVDLREITDAIVARYDESLGGADLQLARHTNDPGAIEHLFVERLTSHAERAEDRPDVVRVTGEIGRKPHAFARMSGDVIAFQEGGDLAKGPVRIATLYAQDKLKKAPRALETEPLKSLRERFGDAPCIGLAVGPFTDEWKKAANGLLEASIGVGCALRPTVRENIGFALALAGDFHDSGDAASATLMDAWDAFTTSEMGHVLGLDKPVEAPVPTHSSDAVALSVELEPRRFAEGLHALVTQDLDELMKF